MTTGRINQVTIVRRGWPTGAAGGAGEMFKLLGGACERRAAHSASGGWPGAPLAAIRFPPLRSPGHPSAALRPLWAVWLGRPRRRTQRAASTMAVSAARGCPLLLCGRTCQRPVAHRTHPAAVAGGACHCPRASPVRREA
jgi:hypothetical protein